MLDSPASITQHAEETGHSGFSVLKAEVPCPDCPQKFKSVAGLEKVMYKYRVYERWLTGRCDGWPA